MNFDGLPIVSGVSAFMVSSDGAAVVNGNVPKYANTSGLLITDSGSKMSDKYNVDGSLPLLGDMDADGYEVKNTGTVRPRDDNTFDLGTPAKRFRSAYVYDQLEGPNSTRAVDDIVSQPFAVIVGNLCRFVDNNEIEDSTIASADVLTTTAAASTYLPLDGSGLMAGSLEMNNNSIREVYEVNLVNNGDISTPPANTIMVYSASKKLKYQDDTHTNFTVATIDDVALKVPYTGATGSVDLGLFTTKCKSSQSPTLTKYVVSNSLSLTGTSVQSMLGAGTGSLVYAANTTNNDMNICFRFAGLYTSGVASTQTLIFAVNGVNMINYVFSPGVMSNVPLTIKARLTPRPPFTLWELTIGTTILTFGLGPVWNTAIANTLTVTSQFSDILIGADIYTATVTSKNQI